MAGGPIHDRDQIQIAMLHRDIGDVGAPDLVGPRDLHAPEQIRIYPVGGMGIRGSGRLINRFQAHQPHKAANPVTAHQESLAPQLAYHLARAVKRIFHEQLIDPPHQRKIRFALAFGGVIER